MVRTALLSTVFAITLLPVAAHAQLTIDMNSIKCDQYLAMSPEMSRDFSAWMSGWFSIRLAGHLWISAYTRRTSPT